jgi:glutamine synthetase
MAVLRFKALEEQFSREPLNVVAPATKVSDYFGMYVFDKNKMQKYLSKDAFKSVMTAINKGERIDRKLADLVASGMKAWAIENGVTHYTHWFQPLTDTTAEKHDTLVEIDKSGIAFENFDGSQLVQAEPDASSFPSGGIRSTFEARGYSAWDPSSPAFIIDDTLCIPSVFISYTGESLDYKTPLLKSVSALDEAAVGVCQYFDKDVTKVHCTLGLEQEYFLVDEALYLARPDLLLTDRSLLGHSSARDQQLEDHYFGAIPERVVAFMKEMEIEAYKLGISLKTRHNEVAPNQFECAPLFAELSLAIDQNQLLMTIMKKVAKKHKFRCLLHEKPFKGINGSGKHNNWSMATNTGVNLLSPGKNPKSNLQFIVFLVNTIKAVYENADLLRASITSAGNEHRLGAQEAPPSIISSFLGTSITKTLNEIEEKVSNSKMTPEMKTELKLDVIKIPEILLDNTDRNRTSPFAFTGNRFEFRAVGSSANSAAPMISLCTAVADQLIKFKADVDARIEADVKKDEAIFQVLRDYIIASKNIRFEGNNYSDEWVEEAAKRGLSNIKDCPTALKAYISPKSIELFEKHKVLSERESHARYEVRLEMYTKKIQIESRVLGDLVLNHIIPTAISYQSQLIQNVAGLKTLFEGDEFKLVVGTKLDTIKEISEHVTFIKVKTLEMIEARKQANNVENAEEKAQLYGHKVKAYFDEIRYHVDKLELIVDDEQWPLPKYRELLFTR